MSQDPTAVQTSLDNAVTTALRLLQAVAEDGSETTEDRVNAAALILSYDMQIEFDRTTQPTPEKQEPE